MVFYSSTFYFFLSSFPHLTLFQLFHFSTSFINLSFPIFPSFFICVSTPSTLFFHPSFHLIHTSTSSILPPHPCFHLIHPSTSSILPPHPSFHLTHPSTSSILLPHPCFHLIHQSTSSILPPHPCFHLIHQSTSSILPPYPSFHLIHSSTLSTLLSILIHLSIHPTFSLSSFIFPHHPSSPVSFPSFHFSAFFSIFSRSPRDSQCGHVYWLLIFFFPLHTQVTMQLRCIKSELIPKRKPQKMIDYTASNLGVKST